MEKSARARAVFNIIYFRMDILEEVLGAIEISPRDNVKITAVVISIRAWAMRMWSNHLQLDHC